MGVPPDCCILQYDKRWEPLAPSSLFRAGNEDVALLSDVTALVLAHLDAASLLSLCKTCQTARAAGNSFRACFDEPTFRDICRRLGWSLESLVNVGVHVSNQRHFTACPPWLSRLPEKLRLPHQHHMKLGVVAKIVDAMGPLDAKRSNFVQRDYMHRRTFVAHVKHGIAEGEPLVTPADVSMLRKLRGLTAYMFAEGWASNPNRAADGDDPSLLHAHALDHALAGRIELS